MASCNSSNWVTQVCCVDETSVKRYLIHQNNSGEYVSRTKSRKHVKDPRSNLYIKNRIYVKQSVSKSNIRPKHLTTFCARCWYLSRASPVVSNDSDKTVPICSAPEVMGDGGTMAPNSWNQIICQQPSSHPVFDSCELKRLTLVIVDASALCNSGVATLGGNDDTIELSSAADWITPSLAPCVAEMLHFKKNKLA